MTGASRNINNFKTNAGRKGYIFVVNGRAAHFFRLRIDGTVRIIKSIRDEGLIGITGGMGVTVTRWGGGAQGKKSTNLL